MAVLGYFCLWGNRNNIQPTTATRQTPSLLPMFTRDTQVGHSGRSRVLREPDGNGYIIVFTDCKPLTAWTCKRSVTKNENMAVCNRHREENCCLLAKQRNSSVLLTRITSGNTWRATPIRPRVDWDYWRPRTWRSPCTLRLLPNTFLKTRART
jgi:hypothetical protein